MTLRTAAIRLSDCTDIILLYISIWDAIVPGHVSGAVPVDDPYDDQLPAMMPSCHGYAAA